MPLTSQKCHYHAGDKECKIAFILSTPGSEEQKTGEPASGGTGDNISKALRYLHNANCTLFPSHEKNYYHITNATITVMYKAVSGGKTEPKNTDVIRPENIKRVVSEVVGAEIVVLCGKKAQLLKKHFVDKLIVEVCHPGNTGLNTTYTNNHKEIKKQMNSQERMSKRIEIWAVEILDIIGRRGLQPVEKRAVAAHGGAAVMSQR